MQRLQCKLATPLEFLILTATPDQRSLNATWDEIDFQSGEGMAIACQASRAALFKRYGAFLEIRPDPQGVTGSTDFARKFDQGPA
jgi:hypothetical protein